MSKKLVIGALVAVLMLGSSIAQATPSRLETLGQETGLVYLQDDTNIFTNPATLGYYRNVGLIHMGDLSSDMDALGGLSLGLGDMLTLGIIVARNPDLFEGGINVVTSGGLPFSFADFGDYNCAGFDCSGTVTDPVDTTIVAPGDISNMDWMNPIDIILAAKLGNIQLGVSYYIATGKFTETNEDDVLPAGTDLSEEQRARIQAVKVGLSAEMGNLMPELWFHYVPFKVVTEMSDDVADLDASAELKGRRFNVGGRVFVKLNDSLTVVPQLEWSNIKGDVAFNFGPDLFDPDVVPTTAAIETEEDLIEEWRGNSVATGIGINYTNDKLLLATSLGLNWSKSVRTLEVDGIDGTHEETSRVLQLPVVGIGAEYQATKILILRAGLSTTTIYSKSRFDVTSDVPGSLDFDNKESTTFQSTEANVGMGLLFGNFLVDLTAGDMIITGEDAFNSLFSALDVKFKF